VGGHLLDANNVKTQVDQFFRNVLCRCIGREMTYDCFYRLQGLWKKGVIGEVIVGEVGFDFFRTTMPLVITLVPFLVLWNSKSSLTMLFSGFYN
jgi:hypothetical protein